MPHVAGDPLGLGDAQQDGDAEHAGRMLPGARDGPDPAGQPRDGAGYLHEAQAAEKHRHHHPHLPHLHLHHHRREDDEHAMADRVGDVPDFANAKVAHLTIEDGELEGLGVAAGDEEDEDEDEDNDGRDNSHTSRKHEPQHSVELDDASPPYGSQSQVHPPQSDGPGSPTPVGAAGGAGPQNHHRHHHDPGVPTAHHHPEHLQAPHTKEERELELMLAYLRAIPSRPVSDPKTYRPQLNVKCGPLVRYLGLRRNGQPDAAGSGARKLSAKDERETWRGSIMIVTTDEHSDYLKPPTIRLFHVDPSAETKASDHAETDSQRYVDGPGAEDEKQHHHHHHHAHKHSKPSKHSKRSKDGEKLGKYEEISAMKLHAERGVTFWRFNVEVELSDRQCQIVYRINHGPKKAFWVPARGQTMNIAFHSCNGFSLSVDPAEFCGPDPLWKDMLNAHQRKPFHVMLGGGDQIYNDAVSQQTTHFKAWLAIKTPFHKSAHEFTPEMDEELESFYLERYSYWFSQGVFGEAVAQIPMINIWDDHDIIDGFGSYPTHFNRCPVFTGLGAVAFKYYMLFQHQSTKHEKEEHEPSWLLGSGPGPFITEQSRSTFMFLGREVAFLGLDCRTERMRDLVVSAQTYNKVFARLHNEIVVGETRHLIVLLGVPIAYPRLVWLENLLTSRIMDPVKALSRMGLLGGFVNNFDGGVELLDDLDDHWTAKNHKAERNWFIKKLQEFAAEHSVRITILGGDVHLAGIGQFFSNPKLDIPRERDHRFMPNIISSAIVNTPPPDAMADILNKRNKIHHLDAWTDEDMYPIFVQDVTGKPRNNKRLLPRRNYASITAAKDQQRPLGVVDDPPRKASTFAKLMKGEHGKKKGEQGEQAGPAGARDGGGMAPCGALDGAGGSRAGADDAALYVSALEVVLHMEADQHDPAGTTVPYRYHVPALTCDATAIEARS